ncbi:TRAP transporter substrate-binding protein [Pseudooceanicola sp. HF7]|uniref:TRAP transporter substrate-binding protein n=1 Tax=Pseudooceanicola sp. HF7 TaxID=2721560 RepID=UPI001430EFBC|nr:TRAP transporter substrate-binding protein [Pseudooceanicola sp. HF7]NIZ08108.1 TRAP transporter substrate-binding protein [Pseudooceanicola sp. HF7]
MNSKTTAKILTTSALIALGAAAQADTALRLAHWLPPSHALQTTGFEPWIESINEASDGKISFTTFPAQQLGSATDHYDIARDGIADIAFVAPSYQPGRFPIISLGEHPFMVTNAIEGSAAFNDWYQQYAATEMPDVHVCMAFIQDPGTLHSVEAVTLPSDLKGASIRPANAVMGSMVSLLGGASIQVPAPEAREVIARGAAEGITFPWDSVYLFGIDKETKYHIDFPLYSTVFVMAMNKGTYEGMPEDERAVLDEHCTSEWAQKVAAGWAEQEQSGRTRAIEDPTHTVHEPTPEELAAWQEATAPLMTAWAGQVTAKGQDPEAVEASFREIMGKADALFE